jgi:hypothetical protein
MPHIQEISLNFPTVDDPTRGAFADLTNLVSRYRLQDQSQSLFPRVAIHESSKTDVALTVDGVEKIALSAGKVPSIGVPLELSQVMKRLSDHVVHVDHIGINLSADNIPCRDLLNFVAKHPHIYQYPTGEPWYFVIPATADELEHGITDFSKLRFPKFEIVLEGEDATPPLIQIDCATNLTRAEVETRLPSPYGISLPGLDDFFRSVFVAHPWGGFLLRMDFRYRSAEAVNEWSSCEWLVQKGTRYDY